MFNLFDKVRIKLNGLIGTIVDISTVKGKKVYIVESDAPNTEGGYGGEWKLYDCLFSEIENV